ncbi:Tryptophan synthase alpha chain [Candidatus Magnetomoraceae bacterium gMMP-15]
MKSAIEERINKVKEDGRAAFIPFLTAGFPDRETSIKLIRALYENGADVIELGVPFSDPLADGPTIQKSSQIALERGMTPLDVLEIITEVNEYINCPIVIMTYFNPIFKMGLKNFASKAVKAGTSGVIIPDLPIEEADEWIEAAESFDLDTIFLVAPTTPPERMKKISSKSKGFLYHVSMTGVTGSAFSITNEMLEEVKKVKAVSSVPVAVGFGISRPDQAKAMAGTADGVIVGSALIRQIQEHNEPEAQIKAVSELAASLSAGCKKV